MDIVSRHVWEDPAMPVVGPKMNLNTVSLIPAHYTAADKVPSDTANYLRSIQYDYTVNRGYSIGYNFAIDKTGMVWECRGFTIKCAANKDWNEETIAVLCLVDGAAAMNQAMVAAFRELGAMCESAVGHGLTVVGHRDIGSTACPGDGIYHQVATGQLTPAWPEPEPEPEPEDMSIHIFTSQSNPREFNAMFFAECDAQGRSIELQWSGNGDDPRVQERIQVMTDNFGPPLPILLAGVRNNRLHPKHKPSDIVDSLHQWTDADFAP
jgi:hypothetical protein